MIIRSMFSLFIYVSIAVKGAVSGYEASSTLNDNLCFSSYPHSEFRLSA